MAWQTLTNKSSRALAEQLFWCSRRPSQGFIGLLVRDQQGCQALAQDIVVATHRLKEGRSFSDWHLERERKQGGLALLGGLLRGLVHPVLHAQSRAVWRSTWSADEDPAASSVTA
jgi:hypothetical protein